MINHTGFKTRGVVYSIWPGDDAEKVNKALARSVESLKKHHPEFGLDEVVTVPVVAGSLLDKAQMFDWSPFDQTLYLDVDTVVMGRLDFAFEMAERYGVACCINECPLARRYGGLREAGDMVEYNTGVLAFTRKAKPLFDAWKANRGMDSSIDFYHDKRLVRMPENDQAGFAKAVYDTGFNPFALPPNWNFRPLWYRHLFGPVKVWHDYTDPPPGIYGWTVNQSKLGAIIDYARIA